MEINEIKNILTFDIIENTNEINMWTGIKLYKGYKLLINISNL